MAFIPHLAYDPLWFLQRCPIATKRTFAARAKSKRPTEPTPESIAAEAESEALFEKKGQKRIETARQFAISAAKMARDTHCSNVVILDVSAISPITDFFIIATGTSPRQMRSVCDDMMELGDESDFAARAKPSASGEQWMLVDFVDVVAHLFTGDARRFYDLENLWGDAKVVEWK